MSCCAEASDSSDKRGEGLDTSVVCFPFLPFCLFLAQHALSCCWMRYFVRAQPKLEGELSSTVVLPVWAQQKFDIKV